MRNKRSEIRTIMSSTYLSLTLISVINKYYFNQNLVLVSKRLANRNFVKINQIPFIKHQEFLKPIYLIHRDYIDINLDIYPNEFINLNYYNFQNLIIELPFEFDDYPPETFTPLLKLNPNVSFLSLNTKVNRSIFSIENNRNNRDYKNNKSYKNSLTHLILDNYSHGLLDFLPSSLISLNTTIGYYPLPILDNLQILILNSVNFDFQTVDFSLFKNLKVLKLKRGFKILKFPKSLVIFKSGDRKYKPKTSKDNGSNFFDLKDLPSNLLELKLNHYHQDIIFNCDNFSNNFLNNLFKLTIRSHCSSKIPISNWLIKNLPSSLEELTIKGYYNYDLENLPPKLKLLKVNYYPDNNLYVKEDINQEFIIDLSKLTQLKFLNIKIIGLYRYSSIIIPPCLLSLVLNCCSVTIDNQYVSPNIKSLNSLEYLKIRESILPSFDWSKMENLRYLTFYSLNGDKSYEQLVKDLPSHLKILKVNFLYTEKYYSSLISLLETRGIEYKFKEK